MRNSPKRIILILALSIMLTTGYIKVTEASSLTRKEVICQKSFIGYEYNPKLENRCRALWTEWTRQILNNQ